MQCDVRVARLGNTIIHTHTNRRDVSTEREGRETFGCRTEKWPDLTLSLTFQEETAHLDASEDQTERIQANLSPC